VGKHVSTALRIATNIAAIDPALVLDFCVHHDWSSLPQ
jgi:hypothetical protein